jgi:hypothetical protein
VFWVDGTLVWGFTAGLLVGFLDLPSASSTHPFPAYWAPAPDPPRSTMSTPRTRATVRPRRPEASRSRPRRPPPVPAAATSGAGTPLVLLHAFPLDRPHVGPPGRRPWPAPTR